MEVFEKMAAILSKTIPNPNFFVKILNDCSKSEPVVLPFGKTNLIGIRTPTVIGFYLSDIQVVPFLSNKERD